jgi:hypothetical protein
MLVQDTLTGYLHEVPDSQSYGAYLGSFLSRRGVIYDGLAISWACLSGTAC